MDPNLGNPTPDATPAATPPQAEPASSPGTVPNNGDAGSGQGAPVDNTFTRVDPNTLPPQVRQAYDNMLRDYKDKTTKVAENVKAEVAKATEAFKQKAEWYDQLLAQEEFVNQWNDYVQRANPQPNQTPDDPASKLTKEVEQLKAFAQREQTQKAIEAFASAVNDKGQKMNVDFDKLNSVVVSEIEAEGGQKRQVSFLGAAIDLSQGKTIQEKLANGYATAKKVYDQIFEEGKKSGMGRLQAKALSGTNPPSNAPPTSGVGRRPENALEALQFARQRIPVSKE